MVGGVTFELGSLQDLAIMRKINALYFHFYVESTKQKQTPRYKEQTGGYQSSGESENGQNI